MPDLPPGCIEADCNGVSHDALLAMLERHAPSPGLFLAGVLAYVREHGATYNQRRLLAAACDHAREDAWAGHATSVSNQETK